MNAPKPLLAALFLAALPVLSHAASVSGTVAETMDSGGYTYLRLQTPEGERWAAVTQAAIKKGAKVEVSGAVEMKNFTSPTLKRKFDRILFGALAEDVAAAKAGGVSPAAAAAAASPAGKDPHAKVAAAVHGARSNVDYGPIKVAKAAGVDARTIAEVYAQRKELAGKTVTVAGKIVKLTPMVMDRNWAHLRDGSGSAKDGSDDLTVTLKDEAKAGDTVTVRGTIVLNKDLGGMYQFPVLLQDAVLVKTGEMVK